jgi:hypothetical protein
MISRSILLSFLSVFLPGQSRAADFSVSAGMNHSWLVYPDFTLPTGNQFRPSYTFGAHALQQVSQDVDASIGLRLFSVGRHDESELGGFSYKVTVNHLYISLPIKVAYYITNDLSPFVSVEPGLQVHSNLEITTSATPTEKRTITREMNRFNIFTGFGLRYLFNVDQSEFSVNGQFNIGWLRVSSDEQFDVTETGSRGWVDWRAREVLIYLEYYFGS